LILLPQSQPKESSNFSR